MVRKKAIHKGCGVKALLQDALAYAIAIWLIWACRKMSPKEKEIFIEKLP